MVTKQSIASHDVKKTGQTMEKEPDSEDLKPELCNTSFAYSLGVQLNVPGSEPTLNISNPAMSRTPMKVILRESI